MITININVDELAQSFGWIKGPAIQSAVTVGDFTICTHKGGDAFSVVCGREYLACTPTWLHALRFVRRSLSQQGKPAPTETQVLQAITQVAA